MTPPEHPPLSCPGYEDLLAWLAADPSGAVDAADRRVLEALPAHLREGCPHCAGRLRRLDDLATSFGGPLPPAVPAPLRDATLARLKAAGAVGPADGSTGARGLVGRVREYFAELLPAPPPALALGLRGERGDRHRIYTAGPYQVDVALVERGSVMGQVSGDEPLMRELLGATCVLCSATVARLAPLARDYTFRFDRLGSSRYLLMIDAFDARLLLPDVDLRDEPDAPV